MLETFYAYICSAKLSLYFLLGGCNCFEGYQCFQMYLGIRMIRLSSHCNGLNTDTLTRECPGTLKSTANRAGNLHLTSDT